MPLGPGRAGLLGLQAALLLAATFLPVPVSLGVSAPVHAAGVAGSAGSESPRPVTREQFKSVAEKLRCQVCESQSVWESRAEPAWEMRAEILRMLREGWTERQILDYYEREFGSWILMSPPKRGLGLLAWLAPAVALLLGVAVLRRFVAGRGGRTHLDAPRREGGQDPVEESATGPKTGPSPAGFSERIERELRERLG